MTKFGITSAEERSGESLDQRLAEQVPDDLFTDEGIPNEDAGEVDEVGSSRAGRLVAPGEGAHGDYESAMLATDAGIDEGAACAEEAAIHIIEE